MDGKLRGALRALNQREERDLQDKLNLLEKQFRYTRKRLQQRRRSLSDQERRVVTVKLCEPKATVNVAMKDIQEHATRFNSSRCVRTSDGRRLQPGKGSASASASAAAAEQSRSISAPPAAAAAAAAAAPPPAAAARPVRRRGNIQSNLSLMQMKNIAAIDAISEKEVVRRQQRAREELELLRQIQRERLHRRVTAFIEKLQDRTSSDRDVEPP